MKMLLAVAALAAVASPAAASAPAGAASAAATPSVAPSQEEALAFARAYSPSNLRRAAELAVLESNFIPGLRRIPETAALLDAFPDLGPALQKAMADQIDVYMSEYDERFYPRAAAIVRESLSSEDVRALTAFYTSTFGQKMLALASQNVDATEVVELAAQAKPVDQQVAARQAVRTGLMTYAKLDEAERSKFLEFMASPAGRKLKAIAPMLAALQIELMNTPGPRFKAASEKAMAEAFKKTTGIDSSGASEEGGDAPH